MDLKFQNELTAFQNIRKTVASTFKIVTISAIHVVIHLFSINSSLRLITCPVLHLSWQTFSTFLPS